MAGKKIVAEWIEKAEEDFGYAVCSLEEKLGFFAQICFHFHQAAEKYLKAYIVKHDLKFRKIHDLLELLEICSKHNKNLLDLRDSCAFLNRFYMSTRYPVHWRLTFSKMEAKGAMTAAKRIGDRIKKFM